MNWGPCGSRTLVFTTRLASMDVARGCIGKMTPRAPASSGCGYIARHVRALANTHRHAPSNAPRHGHDNLNKQNRQIATIALATDLANMPHGRNKAGKHWARTRTATLQRKLRWCRLQSCIYMSARLVQTKYHTDKNTMDEVHRSRIIACPMRSSMSTEPRTWAPKPRPANAWHPSKFCMGLPIKPQAFVGQRRLTTA